MNTDLRQPPDISVVVIVYNDETRLPTAVRSVLEQTLRNVEVVIVDDRSTDGSYEVARGLAAEHPGRVRAFRLDENSGGCGAPRNHGIAQARGTYVLFLDSDDVLERNACRNMLEAAETTGADLVSGLCVRVHVDSRSGKRSSGTPGCTRAPGPLSRSPSCPTCWSSTRCRRTSATAGSSWSSRVCGSPSGSTTRTCSSPRRLTRPHDGSP
ncbi:glycosyltransferase family 2 protein [Streptomyces sp. 2A115]|uniref:glycosyltransferase family 2 protein n=1 Tax=Streptomyces sp. 2A115 TaxID=3457439 RepID=UPI003FD02531